jgi:hypothetical protein
VQTRQTGVGAGGGGPGWRCGIALGLLHLEVLCDGAVQLIDGANKKVCVG